MIITRTPFRISFFGGGTDYVDYFKDHPGASLVTSIDKYCYITARFLPPFFDHKSRIIYSKIEHVTDHELIEHPAVREILKYYEIEKGIEIHHNADLPARTGLGSSSAFAVGLINTIHRLKGTYKDKKSLAEEAIHVEQVLCNEYVGCQDQISTAVGGFNHIHFDWNKGPVYTVDKVKISQERIKELQSHLMLYFTGFSRIASTIAKHQIENIPHKKKDLAQMYKMVERAMDILHTGEMLEFGELLHESWLIKRSLSSKISTFAIDEYYNSAICAGATGGKLLGAGGGGFLLLFAEPSKQPRIRSVLSNLLEVPFAFENTGTQVIFGHE